MEVRRIYERRVEAAEQIRVRRVSATSSPVQAIRIKLESGKLLINRQALQDVVLWTEQGQVTESTIANVVVRIGDTWLTPTASVGLLPGVFRAHLLATGAVREGAVSVSDLLAADEVFLVNSVRGWMKLQREPGGEGWRIATEFEYMPAVGSASLACECRE